MNAAKNKSLSLPGLSALRVLLLLVVTLCLAQTRVWGFGITSPPASGVFESASPSSIGENTIACPYDASDSSLAARAGGGASDDIVRLFHQGNLRGGQVSSTRPLSTSLSSDLSHYHPGAALNEFQVPRSTYNQWMDDGLVMPFNDLHAPTQIVTPELRIMPPATGELNKFLVRPPGG